MIVMYKELLQIFKEKADLSTITKKGLKKIMNRLV